MTRDGWKYVCLEHQPWLMFDLNTDPYEEVNLAHNTRFARERRVLHERLGAGGTATAGARGASRPPARDQTRSRLAVFR